MNSREIALNIVSRVLDEVAYSNLVLSKELNESNLDDKDSSDCYYYYKINNNIIRKKYYIHFLRIPVPYIFYVVPSVQVFFQFFAYIFFLL